MSQLGDEQTPYQTGPGRTDLGEIAKKMAIKGPNGERLWMNLEEYAAQEQFYNNPHKQPKMKDLNLIPIENRIIILPDPVQEVTDAGIHIPDAAQERPSVGTVIGAGPGIYSSEGVLIPMQTKVGDRVYYSPFAATSFPHEGIDYLVIREADLFFFEPKSK
ncbi:co-chaperone GroES [Sphingobacterium mizutaii]|uniref:co-chaperone GroES n=1 Tax=Sphingobacterium mizutaii TaxID=1010 RepID=UPI00289E00A8|nr:co-chaperone GroES [Sphingobacterium mizutaii]